MAAGAEVAASDPLPLPAWAKSLVDIYESNASSQFIVYGNVFDRMLVSGPAPSSGKPRLGFLGDFLVDMLMPRFDVVLSYDVGNGIRVERGADIFSNWPYLKENPQLPKAPRQAIETLTHYFRYCANLGRLSQGRANQSQNVGPAGPGQTSPGQTTLRYLQVGCFIKSADLVAPNITNTSDYDLSAIATLIRDWSSDSLLSSHCLATFLLTENLSDLHPLITNNPRVSQIRIALPGPDELKRALEFIGPSYPVALSECSSHLDTVAHQMSGATLGAVEGMLKLREHRKEVLKQDDLVRLKKDLVEKECNGLIEFLETTRTLDDISGQETVKRWLRQDIALWRANDVTALPKGYLLCGPVGTGKTFMVECLAGEAGVPVVKMKNFRDKWVGSSEGNLEKIFRLVKALGRCYVFIDEADQSLGKRDSGGSDSGTSGRLYSMMAEEMGSSTTRGKVIWVLASSRPDLIEVDLKRPGRVDIKIPLFPTSTAEESFGLIRMLSKKRGLDLPDDLRTKFEAMIPTLLTPGAAEALVTKLYRIARTNNVSPPDALKECLTGYQNPIAPEVMRQQIELAVRESSDLEFIPAAFRTQS